MHALHLVARTPVPQVLLKRSLMVGAWELLTMGALLHGAALPGMVAGQALTYALSLATAALLDARARRLFRQAPPCMHGHPGQSIRT